MGESERGRSDDGWALSLALSCTSEIPMLTLNAWHPKCNCLHTLQNVSNALIGKIFRGVEDQLSLYIFFFKARLSTHTQVIRTRVADSASNYLSHRSWAACLTRTPTRSVPSEAGNAGGSVTCLCCIHGREGLRRMSKEARSKSCSNFGTDRRMRRQHAFNIWTFPPMSSHSSPVEMPQEAQEKSPKRA